MYRQQSGPTFDQLISHGSSATAMLASLRQQELLREAAEHRLASSQHPAFQPRRIVETFAGRLRTAVERPADRPVSTPIPCYEHRA